MFQTETGHLVEQVLNGDAASRGALLERLRTRLVLWAATRMSRRLRAKVEPEDAAQEILLAVHRDLDRFDGHNLYAFFGWLFRVAENRLADLAKYHGAQKRQPVEPRSFHAETASQHAAKKESVANMQLMLERLEPDDQTALRLRYLEERAYPEISELLECSVGAARVRVCRALQALRGEMDRDDDSEDREDGR